MNSNDRPNCDAAAEPPPKAPLDEILDTIEDDCHADMFECTWPNCMCISMD